MFSFEINWHVVIFDLAHIAIAYVLALPIAWDREAKEKSAGLRTFPIVAIASCGFMLTGIDVLESSDAEARVMYGLMTGIGFIGGGAILRDRGQVQGTATAASIWNTGAIGMSVAFRRYEIALVLSLVNFITLLLLGRLEHSMKGVHDKESRDSIEK